jgi:hypothetical protein
MFPDFPKALPTTKPDLAEELGRFVRTKEITIILQIETTVTLAATHTEPTPNEELDDHWEDERQQMLDDYD